MIFQGGNRTRKESDHPGNLIIYCRYLVQWCICCPALGRRQIECEGREGSVLRAQRTDALHFHPRWGSLQGHCGQAKGPARRERINWSANAWRCKFWDHMLASNILAFRYWNWKWRWATKCSRSRLCLCCQRWKWFELIHTVWMNIYLVY